MTVCAPKTPEDIHPAYWPVSFRFAGGYQYDQREQHTDANVLQSITTRSFSLNRFELLTGGLIAPGISFYASYYPAASNIGLPGQPSLHAHSGAASADGQLGAVGFAWVRFADLFGHIAGRLHEPQHDGDGHDAVEPPNHEHGQDLIVGSHELHLTLSGHHRLTNAPYLAYRYDPRVPAESDEAFRLDAPQLGASLDGATPWFGYAMSLYNGTSSTADDNRALDVFATVTREAGAHRVGVFGVRGAASTRDHVMDMDGNPIPGTAMASRPFTRLGADADLNFGPLNLMVFYVYGAIDQEFFVPTADARTARFHGGFVEGDYMIESDRTMLIARYDVIRNLAQGLTTTPQSDRDADAVTLALRRDLVLTSRMNLQFHLEANATRTTSMEQAITDEEQTSNTVYVGIDWSF